MRKILLSVFLLFFTGNVFAQALSIKRLEDQLAAHPQADTFRVNRLNELGRQAGITEGRLDTVAHEAYNISKKINYATGEGFALLNLSNVLAGKGERQQMLPLLQQVYTIAEKTGNKRLMIVYYFRLAGTKLQTAENKEVLIYNLKALRLAESIPDKRLISVSQRSIGEFYQISQSDYARGMEWTLKSIQSAEDAKCLDCLATSWAGLAALYTGMGDHEKSLVYYKKALAANKQVGNKTTETTLFNAIGERYRLMGNYNEAIKAYQQALKATTTPYNIELNESNLADVYVSIGNLPMAFKYGLTSLQVAKKIGDIEGVSWIDGVLARAYLKAGKPDSALYYAKQGLIAGTQTGTIEFMRDNFGALAKAYAVKKDFANAYKYQNLYITYRDSMINSQVSNQTNLLQYNNDLGKKQAQITALNQDKKLQKYFLIGAFVVMAFIALTVIVLLRNNRQKQKANNLLSEQKQIIEEQRDQTNTALADLQLTQKQLIQSEKMASLGELTAGIAHEIQNPLNFVNNFSEVNTELIDEMQVEIDKGDFEEVKAIANDIKENQQKINQHGKRADFIVKGMLQHSRTNTGERQLTNINTLADEFLKLSYHGLRAKDKTFNTEIITNFDEKLPKIMSVQQDIGRLLLNLFNNAMYAVNQKHKTAGAGYKAEVSVTTSTENGQLVIKVKDNGNGIPEAIKDKIMQPFFTTKPTGEGTGLGLSLSYDIIKAHNGKIGIDSTENEYTVFTVQLPV